MSEQWSEKDIELANRLFDMARDGDTAQLKAYLDAGVSTRLRNHAGDSFLTLAAYHEHPDTVAMLIEAGAEIEHANDRGQRALTCATFKRDVVSMRHLLAAGADPDAGTPSARQTAQMFAGADLLAVLDGEDAAPASEA
ncbi:ankyrin repeat domain-containing protein [Micrococcus luteus]|uniref:ankyrin repeat domain-containing protein n=1 Tax=Micrococcus luteus TaxID=1270 RepID=UPI0037B68BE9